MANPLTYIGPAIFPNGPGQAAGSDNIGGLQNNQAKALGAVGTAGTQYYDDLIPPIQLTSALSGVSATGSVSFYIIAGETSAIAGGPWTNGIDPNSNQNQSALLTGLTPLSPAMAMTANNTTYVFRQFSIYAVLGFMPTFWSLVVYNQSGAALPLTAGGNHVIKHSYLISGGVPGPGIPIVLSQATTYADTGEAYFPAALAGGGVAPSANLVTGVNAAGDTIRSNYPLPVGLIFTVGSQPVTVTALGRYKVLAGDNQTHTLYILDPNNVQTGSIYPVVTQATVNIGTGGAGSVNTFIYGNTAAPTTLQAGSTYYLVSTETSGGDSWYDSPNLTVTTTAAATVQSGVYMNGPAFNQAASASSGALHSFGPLDFQYNTTLAPPVPVRIDFSPVSPVSVLDTGLGPPTPTVIATITVTTSDASAFSGTLGFAAPNFDAGGLVAFAGRSLTLTRNLSTSDDGAHLVTVIATQNAVAKTAGLTLSVVSATQQSIVGVNLTSNVFVGGPGSANTPIGTAAVVLSPSSSSASGIVWSLAGTDASRFAINPSTGAYSCGSSDVPNGSYSDVEFVPTNSAYIGSGTHFTKTLTGSAATVSTVAGSPYSSTASGIVFVPNSSTFGSVVSGVITIQGRFNGALPGTLTYQWVLNGSIVISPVLTGVIPDFNDHLAFSFDTTAVADGTYIFYIKILDWDSGRVQDLQPQAQVLIIHNGVGNPSIAAGQVIPIAPKTIHSSNGMPDLLTYNGIPNPVHTTYPFAYTFIDPASGPGGLHSTSLRDQNNWWAEVLPGPRQVEYTGDPQWCTSTSGGVCVNYPVLPHSTTSPPSYTDVVLDNAFDGTRLNNLVSPYVNFVEDPNVSAQWWGVELNGRVLKIDRAGNVTAVFGPTRDKSRLTLNRDFGYTDDEVEAIQTELGTWPADLDAANDLCFDPRDSNIIYIVMMMTNWIARINLTTKAATIYAGVPSTYLNGGYADNANPLLAQFQAPTSIIMSDGTGSAGPIGTMYVCDSLNSAIRKIAPGSLTTAGAITTLCGGTVGPAPPTLDTLAAFTTIHAVNSPIVWNTGTNSGPIVTAAPHSMVAGQTLLMFGSTNSLGQDVNYSSGGQHRFIISSVADNTHFNIIYEPNNYGQIPIGTLTGTITLQELNVDFYSPPGPVSFAAGYVPLPNVIRFNSAGNIVVGDGADCARLINLTAHTITRLAAFENHAHADTGWYWLAVDTAGTCGPADDVFQWKVQDDISAAHYNWRHSSTPGTIPGIPAYSAQFTNDNGGGYLPNNGPAATILAGPGHYPWAVALSTKEGRFITSGIANWQPTHYRIKQPSDPTIDIGNFINFNQNIFNAGHDVNYGGTVPGFPWMARPSFYARWGIYGATFIGTSAGPQTFEDLAVTYPSTTFGDANSVALGNFVRAGMGGAVPRPEMTGNDWRNYEYFIRRCTMQGNLGPTPYPAGANDPDTTLPQFLTLSASRLSPTTVQISWTCNKPAIGLAGCGSATQAVTWGYYPMWTLEPAFVAAGVTHTVVVTVPSGMTTIHYTAVARDSAGNISHTADQTVAANTSPFPDGSFLQAPATGNTGANVGSVANAYGTFTFGDLYAPVPHYGGGQFYVPLLNGVPLNPGYFYIWSEFFFVGFGGNLFSMLTSDQLLASWSNNSWNGDYGQNAPGPFTGFPGPVGGSAGQVPLGSSTPPPTLTPPPPLPTTWAGPYTPSADGTALASGAAGTLTAARGDGGHFSFGAASGGGWVLMREGIPVAQTNAGPGVFAPYIVTHMQINAQGSLFFQTTDGAWHVWNCWQANPAAGPAAGPIPIMVNFSPPNPAIPLGSVPATFVTNVTTTMSDGSAFSGTLSCGLDTSGGSNGGLQTLRPRAGSNNVLELNLAYTGAQAPVTVSQNGCSLVTKFNAR